MADRPRAQLLAVRSQDRGLIKLKNLNSDPRAAGVPWTSDESYQWLPGSFFVMHRWNAQMGKHDFKGAEIMGYDEAEGGYFTRMFDNAGHHPDYAASVDGDVWSFTEAQTRATVTVQDGGDKMTFNWEWKNGGRKWLPLCDRVAVRTPGGGALSRDPYS